MLKNKFLKSVSLLLTTGLVLAFVGCGTKTAGVSNIKNKGKIVMGTSADYPPYEFHSEVNGKDEVVGFDVEIAKQIAKDLGVELEIKDMKFEGLLPALTSGGVDFILAGMTPDAERAKSVDFSNIYYKAVQGIVVRTEDKDKYKTLEDLKGKAIGAQKGTVQEKLVQEQIKGADLKGLGKVTDLVLQLKSKKVDAIVMELPVAEAYAKHNNDIVVSGLTLKSEEQGSAVAAKKGSTELIQSINKTIDRLNKEKAIDKFVAEANNKADANSK